jgi:ATP-dependent exoDNAse (exonuclease V) beta subunit
MEVGSSSDCDTVRKTGLLARVNYHPRDDQITFVEEGHVYTVQGMEGHPTSVTTLIHHFFPEFNADMVIDKMMRSRNWLNSKYYGKTKEQIKEEWKMSGEEASRLGTLMHADIENFLNQEPVLNPDSIEFGYFMKFWEGFQIVNPTFKPYRTEWLVFDEDKKIAGSIDCTLSDDKGNIVILDWKRSKEIKKTNNFEKGLGPLSMLDNCNYNHYTLQLNIYRHILETRYEKRVVGMFIVVFHPNNEAFQVHTINKFDVASVWDELTRH